MRRLFSAERQNAGYLPYYIYRQKNTVDNLENVGFALPGTEGLYNIYMMEEIHSIFAVGAGAVSKMVSRDGQKSIGFLNINILMNILPIPTE